MLFRSETIWHISTGSFSYIFLLCVMTVVDDARKITTPNSSMMGRPDLQPQPVKVRTRRTCPERNRKDEILIISS